MRINGIMGPSPCKD